MTEREFLREAIRGNERGYSREDVAAHVAQMALKLARGLGAEFDPEPVEKLPELRVGRDLKERIRIYVDMGSEAGHDLTSREAAEIVRRCNAWEQVRGKVATWPNCRARNEVLAIMDGQEGRH